MGSKSRPFHKSGVCLKECKNKDKKCESCLRFSEWDLPEIITLSTLASWLERREEWLPWGRCKHVMKEKGNYSKVSTLHALKIFREVSDEDKGARYG